MFRTPHVGHPRHDDRLELATVQMPPSSLFVIVNLHPLLTLRAPPEGVGKTDPHLDFPLLGLQAHALHPLLTVRPPPEGVGKPDPPLDFPLLGLQAHALPPPRFH